MTQQRPQEFPSKQLPVIPPNVSGNALQRILEDFSKRLLQLERVAPQAMNLANTIAARNPVAISGTYVSNSAAVTVAAGANTVMIDQSATPPAEATLAIIVWSGIFKSTANCAGNFALYINDVARRYVRVHNNGDAARTVGGAGMMLLNTTPGTSFNMKVRFLTDAGSSAAANVASTNLMWDYIGI